MGFFSRQLRGAAKRYPATELECLGIAEAVVHFEVYLQGANFKIVTNHRALEAIRTSAKLNARLARWALFLQQFQFKVQYRPGTSNIVADVLSTQAWEEESALDMLGVGRMERQKNRSKKKTEDVSSRDDATVKEGEM